MADRIQHPLTVEDFDAILTNAGSGRLVVVDFTASWCGPCRHIAPVFQALSQKHTNVVFVKIDVDEASEISEREGIRSMPTFLFFVNGRRVREFSGADEQRLEQTIQELGGNEQGAQSDLVARFGLGVFFEGSVQAAIGKALSAKAILLVCVTGEDNDSKRMDAETWTHPSVQDELKSSRVVALRLEQGTELASSFAQLFPVPSTPTVYLIGAAGRVHWQHTGFASGFDVLVKLNKATEDYGKPPESTAAPSPAAASGAPAHSAAPARAPSAHSTRTAPNTTASAHNSRNVPSSAAAGASPRAESASGHSSDGDAARARAEALQKKVEEARRRRAEEEQRAEKQREEERREAGKALQEQKRQREEVEKDLRQRERERERRADLEERKRLRQLLQQDRLDRQGKTSSSYDAKDTDKTESSAVSSGKRVSSATSATNAHIAIRQTNGEVIRDVFRADDRLQHVADFVHTHRTDGSGPFELRMTLPPRKLFGAEHMTKTLRDLDLAPSAVLVMTRPEDGRGAGSGNQGIPASDAVRSVPIVGGIIALLQNLLAWLNPWNYFGQPSAQQNAQTNSPHAQDRGQSGTGSSASSSSPSVRRRFGANTSSLGDLQTRDDDEANKYWNGNSTQFDGGKK